MESIYQILEKLKASIPIEWDRYTVSEDLYYVVYGWIQRPDSQRDFIMIAMWGLDMPEDIFYATSSAKYSEQIHQVLYGEMGSHNQCRKIEELYALAEPRIVVNENSFVGFSPAS